MVSLESAKKKRKRMLLIVEQKLESCDLLAAECCALLCVNGMAWRGKLFLMPGLSCSTEWVHGLVKSISDSTLTGEVQEYQCWAQTLPP